MKPFPSDTFGIQDFCELNPASQFIARYRNFNKIIFLRTGGRLSIDFNDFELQRNCVLFVGAGQFLKLSENCKGTVLYYNQAFYGVQLHDQAIAYDEPLFSSLYTIPFIKPDKNESTIIWSIFDEIKKEIIQGDINLEEMVRLLLKQIILRLMRLWNHQQGIGNLTVQHELGFSRFFARLVENNFLKHHDVASYARILNISAKALNKRVTKYSGRTPHEIIKTRIILEAQRLLVYTPLSVKEIGYKLGYNDPSYFIRFFSKQVQIAPQAFRLHFHGGLNAVA